jgi:hypothetical protein
MWEGERLVDWGCHSGSKGSVEVLVFVTMNLYMGVHEIGSREQHKEAQRFLDRFGPLRG